MKMKADLLKLPKGKNLHKRNRAVSAAPKFETQRSFSFTKPSDTFGKPAFLAVAKAADGPSRNAREERAGGSNAKEGTKSFGMKSAKSFGTREMERAEDGRHTSESRKNTTPAETARFREKSFENEAKTKVKPQKKEQKKSEQVKNIKKPKMQINEDRIKVNMLESKIFQKEAMVKNWLQKSSVITRAANSNYQKALNADALKYQDKVITK